MKQQKLDFNSCKIFYYLRIAAFVTGAAFLFLGCENNIEKIKT